MYIGSSLYQRITVDCSALNSSYTGNWYCATIDVCETDISPSRECNYIIFKKQIIINYCVIGIRTRGCATYEQCFTDGGIYSGQTLYNANNQIPAGSMSF